MPDLSGDDVGGGLGSLESSPIFAAGAIDSQAAKELFKPKDEGTDITITIASLPGSPIPQVGTLQFPQLLQAYQQFIAPHIARQAH